MLLEFYDVRHFVFFEVSNQSIQKYSMRDKYRVHVLFAFKELRHRIAEFKKVLVEVLVRRFFVFLAPLPHSHLRSAASIRGSFLDPAAGSGRVTRVGTHSVTILLTRFLVL